MGNWMDVAVCSMMVDEVRVERKRGGDLVCTRLTRWNFRPCGDASRANCCARTKIAATVRARDHNLVGGSESLG
jgi:hypothetical protein